MADYIFNLPPETCISTKIIFEECIDVAFVVYYFSKANIGIKKFEDLVFQIFPTALVYSSAYWPFYKNSKNEPICLCRHFHMVCRHAFKPGSVHCLDVTNEDLTFQGHQGKIKPLEYVTQLMHTPGTLPLGFLISVKIYANVSPNPEINPRLTSKANRTMPCFVFDINSVLRWTAEYNVVLPRYKFFPSPGLLKNAGVVLNLRKSNLDFSSEDRLYKGYQSFLWTLRPSAVPIINHVRVRRNAGFPKQRNKYERYEEIIEASFYKINIPEDEVFHDLAKSLQNIFKEANIFSNEFKTGKSPSSFY